MAQGAVRDGNKMKTLRDYIAYQRENGYMQEADYFEKEVVAILKQFGCENPLDLDHKEVGAKLAEINNSLVDELSATMDSKKGWDVVLSDTY